MNIACKHAEHSCDHHYCAFNDADVFAETLCMSRVAMDCSTSTASFATTFAFRLESLSALSLTSFAVILNLFLQLKRYDACCSLYKELCAFELKYKYEQQIFTPGLSLLRLKKTPAVVKSLTHSQLMKMVLTWQKMWQQLVVEQEQAILFVGVCKHL
jgi:hypothetical protein